MRLDNYLIAHNYFESRNRAQEAIKSGLVCVGGRVVNKPSFKVSIEKIEVTRQKFYVSRAAKKLEEYLKEYSINFKDAKVLDIGSSTGGFTQVTLEAGAEEVDCVDVGSNQLHYSLRENPKVSVYEECDIRDFSGSCYDIVVSDVSFISLLKIVDSIDKLTKSGSIIVLLFKPQFEVGVGVKRNSKGVVQDKKAIARAKEAFLAKTKELNWRLLDNRESKIRGKEGNIEEFCTFAK